MQAVVEKGKGGITWEVGSCDRLGRASLHAAALREKIIARCCSSASAQLLFFPQQRGPSRRIIEDVCFKRNRGRNSSDELQPEESGKISTVPQYHTSAGVQPDSKVPVSLSLFLDRLAVSRPYAEASWQNVFATTFQDKKTMEAEYESGRRGTQSNPVC